jgi:hypothetical protein
LCLALLSVPRVVMPTHIFTADSLSVSAPAHDQDSYPFTHLFRAQIHL